MIDGNETTHVDKPRNRLIGLDVLRFIAALLVLHIHVVQHFGVIHPNASAAWLEWIITAVAAQGRNGVDIFFVLSGFLVAGLFFDELKHTGTVSPGRFLIRRGFKIYPQFWLFTALTAGLQLFGVSQFNLKGLWSDLLFLQSYVPGLWLHTWSLSVEEHFYFLLAGLFAYLKLKRSSEQQFDVTIVPKICLGTMLFCLTARFLTWLGSWGAGFTLDNAKLFSDASHVRMDSLAFGVLLAYFWHQDWDAAAKAKLRHYRWPLLGVGCLLVLTPYPTRIMEFETWMMIGYNLLYVGAGCLLLAALTLDRQNCPRFIAWLAWLGKYSYAVYLWHMMILWAIKPFTGTSSATPTLFLAKEAFVLVLIWASGIALTKLIEAPMLRVRDRLFPSKA